MKLLKIICLLFTLLFIPTVKAEEINIYLFYSKLCSTCASEEIWLEEYIKDKDVNVIKYEVTEIEENAKLLNDVRAKLKNKNNQTPYTVIGTTGITGFDETQKSQIDTAIIKYNEEYNYVDIVDAVINNNDVQYEIYPPSGKFILPILGEIDPKTTSLPLISIVVGFIDGFNPCAMWVLLFLISMILGMKNRRKMWTIGLTFLISSALIYLCFMLAWLKIAVNLSSISIVRFIIALIALIGGLINIKSYLKERKKDNGCQVVDANKRQNITSKMKKIIALVDNEDSFWKSEKSFILALIGVVGISFSVNIVELTCSAGLPLIFTQILAINNLPKLLYLFYILLYILFFLIDDIIVFYIAMKTMKITGISTKYNKLSHLIGGIIMILISILMIFKPEWLMFNF